MALGCGACAVEYLMARASACRFRANCEALCGAFQGAGIAERDQPARVLPRSAHMVEIHGRAVRNAGKGSGLPGLLLVPVYRQHRLVSSLHQGNRYGGSTGYLAPRSKPLEKARKRTVRLLRAARAGDCHFRGSSCLCLQSPDGERSCWLRTADVALGRLARAGCTASGLKMCEGGKGHNVERRILGRTK